MTEQEGAEELGKLNLEGHGTDGAKVFGAELGRIEELAAAVESISAACSATWRTSKYRIKGLKKAAQYNSQICIVKGFKPDSSRMVAQLIAGDKVELSISRENLELSDPNLSAEREPILSASFQRLQLSKSTAVPDTPEGVESSLRNCCQALLDITFQVENELVDKDLRDKQLLQEVLSLLDGVEAHCLGRLQSLRPDQTDVSGTHAMVELLGEGVAEAFHWRRGALRYMHVAILNDTGEVLDVSEVDEALLQLLRMLQTRGKRMAASVDDAEGNDDVKRMIQEGILSDTHLLATVYSGEICYWACMNFSKPGSQISSEHAARLRGLGIEYLERYLWAIDTMTKAGPGSVGHGWDSERAKGLLSELKKP